MKKPHTIIYIPGLGDRSLRGQGVVLKLWQIYGVKTRIYRIFWADNKPFEDKFQNLLKEIDRLSEAGNKVSFVGVSAGASTALAAFAQRKSVISGVVCICGKINNAQTVHEVTYKQNPSFKESMKKLGKNMPELDKASRGRILSIHPLHDNIVPLNDTKIKGAREKTILTAGHIFSIVYAITIGSFGIVKFLKQLAQG